MRNPPDEMNSFDPKPTPPQPDTHPSIGSTFERGIMRLSEAALSVVMKSQTRIELTSHNGNHLILPSPQTGHEYTLYVHVPFCASLCPYCSFNRYLYEQEKAQAYFECLRLEMQHVANLGYDFSTLYIGGGTPTINLEELLHTIDLARQLFQLKEVSCETNPNHLTTQYVDALSGRVQRLSVGVQSFDATLLQQMNRLEKFGTGAEILERIRYAAPFFESLNVDMIFDFPSQTPEMLERDLDLVLASAAQQVTFYPLMSASSVEKSMANSVGKPRRTREWDYFNLINDRLETDFKRLSAWTFVRKQAGMIDEYIVDSEEYVGIGSGSFSYLDGTLYVNHFSLVDYQNAIQTGQSPVSAHKNYSLRAQMRYWFMMHLFGLRFDLQQFKRRFRRSAWAGLLLEMLFMSLTGSIESGTPTSLNRRGQYLSLVMMREFFSGVNNLRDLARSNLSAQEMANAMPVRNPGVHKHDRPALPK